MNGGGPLATSLRALRRDPALVDDVGVIPRLAAAAHGSTVAGLAMDVEEFVRWTRAWLIVWQGALQARGVIGTVAPWTVAVPIDEVPAPKGDPDHRRRNAALGLLERAGLMTLGPDRSAATLAESAFVSHRAGLEIDWAALARAVRHEPAPLLAARALAELVVPSTEPTVVTLRELADRTGYAPKQARVALRRLVDAGIVRISESSGAAARYWFDSGANVTGDRAPEVRSTRPALAAPAAIVPPLVTPAPASVASQAPVRQQRVAVRMTLNGVTFGIAAGLTPHVELGPDGIPHVTFDLPDPDA